MSTTAETAHAAEQPKIAEIKEKKCARASPRPARHALAPLRSSLS
jgi:hypothetical protein